MSPAAYDRFGVGYRSRRRPDPRIAAQIEAALGDAQRIVNVGAGTGNYEPVDRDVIAVEPSSEMIAQRSDDAAPVVQASAEALPFDGDSFDVAMGVLTIHHWSDPAAGLHEMRRVARDRVVLLTFDAADRSAWLLDYLPQNAELDARTMPPLELYGDVLGPVDVTAVPVPHDCVDGFLYAYWRRPEAYLDPGIRSGMSTFHRIADVDAGLDRLAKDLDSGAWDDRYGHLRTLEAMDLGYRLVVTR